MTSMLILLRQGRAWGGCEETGDGAVASIKGHGLHALALMSFVSYATRVVVCILPGVASSVRTFATSDPAKRCGRKCTARLVSPSLMLRLSDQNRMPDSRWWIFRTTNSCQVTQSLN